MSYLVEYVDFAVAMTATQESAEMFEEHLPPSCVHREFSERTIQRIIHHQNTAARKKKQLKHVLIVLDDLMFDKRVVKGRDMREIYMVRPENFRTKRRGLIPSVPAEWTTSKNHADDYRTILVIRLP